VIYKRCVGLAGHDCDIHLALAHPLPFRLDSVRQTSYERCSLSVSRKAGDETAICVGLWVRDVPHRQRFVYRYCHLARKKARHASFDARRQSNQTRRDARVMSCHRITAEQAIVRG
jgi:hypothetical protein